MFKEMRRQDRKISHEECISILNKGSYGVLSTIGNDGYPYGIPLSYSYKDGRIFFHCAKDGMKVDNFLFNNKVSFCVVGEVVALPNKFSTKYESVIIFGTIMELDGDEKNQALFELIKKYSSGYIEEGKKYINKSADITRVFAIKIEHITGKARR